MSMPGLVFPDFPYKDLKITPQQREELTERINKIRYTLTDLKQLAGYVMSMDEGSIANIAGHLALAGTFVEDDKAFIEPDIQSNGFFDWNLKPEFSKRPRPKVVKEEPSKAQREVERVKQNLSAEERKELAQFLAEEFQTITSQPAETRRDIARASVIEAELREGGQ